MAESLYIHIPFCISKKCSYCDFYSIVYNDNIVSEYFKALLKELEKRKDEITNLKTIYLGGGTPSIIAEEQFARVFELIYNTFTVSSDAEITIEANPAAIKASKLKFLRNSLAVNRISLGVQSFIDSELKSLGRAHTSRDAQIAIEDITRYFTNYSFDLIYGIPSQSLENWQYNLNNALSYKPKHISTYELTIEKNTPLYYLVENKAVDLIDEETIITMYRGVIDRLNLEGYEHYEISNFCLSDYECVHNLNYWKRGEYVGIGAAAHSFIDNARFSNVSDVNKYIEMLNAPAYSSHCAVDETLELSSKDELAENVFLGLRLTKGIKMPKLKTLNAVEILRENGFLLIEGENIKLTPKGILVSNQVIGKILEGLDV
ncbi:oxygen-independent coproporphyrinogen III oxidase [Candidatus Magnetoovum chiemensis]|nr:oxygen-independent coproporphyrinogen III oxidase [Candidatus Magnetoovum chiemensis]